MSTAMAKLNRSNRFLAMLSRVNRTIVRAESPDHLYFDACCIAVESGLFQYAWIGLIDPVAQKFRQIAHCGKVEVSSRQCDAQGEVAHLVLQSKNALIFNDLNVVTPGHPAHLAMLALGFQSMAGFPLWEMDRLIGVFLFYGDSPDVFDQDATHLLTEVAEDISFSLGHMRAEQQRMAGESKLHYLAFYDAQTGLPNRAMLDDRLPKLAAHADQTGSLLVMLNVKLQHVEQLIQVLGKLAMDDVLRTIASRLDACRGLHGLLVQLAHDEFVIVSHELTDSAMIDAFAKEVRKMLAQPLTPDNRDVYLQVGIGIAAYPLHDSDVGNLLRRARAATERSTDDDGYRLYSSEMDHGLEQRVQMLADLHRALERNEFILHFQPQLNLKTGMIVGVEALLRWQHPTQGLISPMHFIPLLEESGLMPKVGGWVLRVACQQAQAWQDAGYPPLRMAVNLSAQQFRSTDLVATVKQALDDAQLEAEYLELELTESQILESVEKTIAMMYELKSLGVSLSLDDFGTGYSSLSYLRRYPVDRIKIDQSFVRDMMQHPGSAALVRSILAMATNLGLKTIAEGVETKGQHGYLRKQMCQEMQGFLYSRAVPPQDIAQLLIDGGRLLTDEVTSNAGVTLLIVDDEPNVLTALRRVFRKEGWLILTAANATEGFELLATHEVGVVMSDQRMPGMTGTEFLHTVKEMYPDTIRILFTGYADFSSVIDAVNRGDLYKVLSKPMDDASLKENIHQAFRRFEVFAENRRLLQRVELLERLSIGVAEVPHSDDGL